MADQRALAGGSQKRLKGPDLESAYEDSFVGTKKELRGAIEEKLNQQEREKGKT